MITREQITAILVKELGEQPENIKLCKVGMNYVFETFIASGPVMLKVYNKDRRHVAEKEFLVLQLARAAGVAVPMVISHGYQFNDAYLLYHKVPGSDLEYNALLVHEQEAFINDLLGNIQAFSKIKMPFYGSIADQKDQFTTWSGFLTANVAYGFRHLSELNILTKKEFNYLKLFMSRTPDSKISCMVWGDIKPENILINDHRFAAVIDFESCFYGDPALALGYLYASEGESSFYLTFLSQIQKIFKFEQRDVHFYTILRLLRISQFLKLPLPSGKHREPVLQYFHGIRDTINHIVT